MEDKLNSVTAYLPPPLWESLTPSIVRGCTALIVFYTETADGTAPKSLPSDQFLSNSTETSSDWNTFGGDASAWLAAFVPA